MPISVTNETGQSGLQSTTRLSGRKSPTQVSERKRVERSLDKATTDYVRIKAAWRCFRCGRFLPPPYSSLQTSHFFGRSCRGTRWYPPNLDAACPECHRIVEGGKSHWYAQWKKEQLGEKGFRELRDRAYGISKHSTAELRALLKEIRSKTKQEHP